MLGSECNRNPGKLFGMPPSTSTGNCMMSASTGKPSTGKQSMGKTSTGKPSACTGRLKRSRPRLKIKK